jgi:hypothetical protein
MVLPDERIRLWHAPGCASAPAPDDRVSDQVEDLAHRQCKSAHVYVPGGSDHSRPWAAPARERLPLSGATASYILAARPNVGSRGHLFRRPGEWCLCDVVCWIEVQRLERVDESTWICAACQEVAAQEVALSAARAGREDAEQRGQVSSIRRGECPGCGARLTDPRRSAGGWRHCARCRRGWAVETQDGHTRATSLEWPASGTAS